MVRVRVLNGPFCVRVLMVRVLSGPNSSPYGPSSSSLMVLVVFESLWSASLMVRIRVLMVRVRVL